MAENIAVIRILGKVKIDRKIKESFKRINLNKKYSCMVFVNPTEIQKGIIKKLNNFIAFGRLDDKTFERLIEARGIQINKSKRIIAKEIIDQLSKGKKFEEVNLKSVFRLHPPRGGIKSKLHFPKGVLGNHGDKINKLIERML